MSNPDARLGDLEAGEGEPLYEAAPPAAPAYAPARCARRAR